MDEVGLSGVRYRPELPGEEADVRSVITDAFGEPATVVYSRVVWELDCVGLRQ